MNDATELLNDLLDRQKQAWLDGRRPTAEDSLLGTPLADDTEVLLDLIYNEILIREELGERPTLHEYLGRYPHLKDDIKLHFDVHAAVQNEALGATRRADDGDLSAESNSFEVGPNLRDYEIISELGRGGMGVVFKARHRLLKRLVAVKMIPQERFPSPRELARFQKEAEAVARLQHPNIVQIFEVGQSGKTPYIALEYAERGTLAQKLQTVTLPPRDAAQLLETLARAVDHAHSRHIIHRDLKPANILFTYDDVPKISDFGLAKILQDDQSATGTGEPLGTPRYMSPEQASGDNDAIGPATDIYALGTILYECLTGQVPFVANTVLDTMEKIRRDEPAPPRRLQPTIPRDLETICLACLHKNPERRYASATDLADDLRRFLDHKPIRARRTPGWEHAYLWSRRRPAAAALIAICVSLVVIGGALFATRETRENRRIAAKREQVITLLTEGRGLLDQAKEYEAKARFQSAWAIVLAEPALHDLVDAAGAWMHDARNRLDRAARAKRQLPPQFDECFDDAVLDVALLDPRNDLQVKAAREAIDNAIRLAPAEPNTDLGCGRLKLLSIDLDWRTGDKDGAVDRLKQSFDGGIKNDPQIPWDIGRLRLAAYYDQMNLHQLAKSYRQKVQNFPIDVPTSQFLSGIDEFHKRDYRKAEAAFDSALLQEPDFLAARCLQAICHLELKKPAEAKIGLTACLGQRPNFSLGYLLRGLAEKMTGDSLAAAGDWQMARDFADGRRRKLPNYAVFTELGWQPEPEGQR